MDITTVLAVIEMIEVQLKSNVAHPDEKFYSNTYSYRLGNIDALTKLRDHLQCFIEGQLSSAEL